MGLVSHVSAGALRDDGSFAELVDAGVLPRRAGRGLSDALSFLTKGLLMLISSEYIHLLVFVHGAGSIIYHWCRNKDQEQDLCSQRMAGHAPGIWLSAL